MTLAYFDADTKVGTHMFGLVVMRLRTFEAHVAKWRTNEYGRGYTAGHADGVVAGHSHEWHDGYNEGTRTQNAIDIMTRTVKTDDKVYTIRSLVEHMRGQNRIIVLKDKQIELLQNKVVSLQSIIRILDEPDWSEVDE